LVFADFLLSSIEYGICIESGEVLLLDWEQTVVVAETLTTFLLKCTRGDRSIWGADSNRSKDEL